VKVSSWYDNEWGFSNRMLDVTMALMRPPSATMISPLEELCRRGSLRGNRVHPLDLTCPRTTAVASPTNAHPVLAAGHPDGRPGGAAVMRLPTWEAREANSDPRFAGAGRHPTLALLGLPVELVPT